MVENCVDVMVHNLGAVSRSSIAVVFVQYLYYDSKLLATVVCFAELV